MPADAAHYAEPEPQAPAPGGTPATTPGTADTITCPPGMVSIHSGWCPYPEFIICRLFQAGIRDAVPASAVAAVARAAAAAQLAATPPPAPSFGGASPSVPPSDQTCEILARNSSSAAGLAAAVSRRPAKSQQTVEFSSGFTQGLGAERPGNNYTNKSNKA
jgi:hypothetical protein